MLCCFVFWKCRYGYGHVDESFTLTIPYRLLQGDALFQEEWHLSQMAGFLLMPIVGVFLWLQGSTEGILLAMRYVCTAVHCGAALLLYMRLRKINWLGAAAAAISFGLYLPFGVMTLSYNSMGIQFLAVSTVILLTAQKQRKIQYFVAGLLFAAAVLCCPYLLLVYAVYIAAVVIIYLSGKQKQEDCVESIWTIRSALWITAGAAALAVLFAAFVLGRGDFESILRAFPAMFADPEHLPSPRFEKTKTYFSSIIFSNFWTPYLYAVLLGLWLVCILDKKRKDRKAAYTVIVSAVIIPLMLSHYYLNHYLNKIMWSMNMMTLFVVLLADNHQIRTVFHTVCIPGLLYSYCLHLSSNQRFYAISSASAVACVGSFVILGLFFCELCSEKGPCLRKAAAGLICAIMIYQITSQTVIRYEFVFWERGMEGLTYHMTDGIEKGIIASEEYYYDHNEQVRNLQQLNQYEGDKVLFLSPFTWYYLEAEKEFSTYSAWLSGVNETTLDRLGIYYDINPHKIPDIVFADEEYLEMAEEFGRRFSYTMEKCEGGYILVPQ